MASHLPETHKIVCGSPVATSDGGITGDRISLKTARKVTIIAHLLQAVGHATSLGVSLSTDVAGGGATAMVATMSVWRNANIATSDALTKIEDAATVAASGDANNQALVMEILPERLPAGFPCIAATLSDSSQATNFASITYLVESKYPQKSPPSVRVD